MSNDELEKLDDFSKSLLIEQYGLPREFYYHVKNIKLTAINENIQKEQEFLKQFEPVGLVSPELYNHIEKLLKDNPDIPWKINKQQ